MEGQVSIGSESLGANSAGSAILGSDQTLTTQNGKAEILLTPGVFARIGDNSSIEMVSPGLTHTQISVEKGEAIVEVAEIHSENNLLVNEDGATIQLQKTGLYDFDAEHSQFRVFEGQAMVQTDDKRAKVKGGHELALNVPVEKSQKFDKKSFEADDLYRWSSLRSAYLAEANVDAAPGYLSTAWDGWYGGGWIGAGWYWDPWFSCYTFIPGDGIFYSP
ncbi:MAG: FecR domain-containing protein, partial [Terracidiphilus sp.]